MHLQDREFQKQRFTHYLHTGRRLTKQDNLDTKIIGDRVGRTFDLVARNLLSYVTRSRAFREAKTDFQKKSFNIFAQRPEKDAQLMERCRW
ncbi:hypothetical protein [Luteithermobacter gelatinilyticus]|uniref:hypothetical protein n=1 Tax=Luteithermobacter gelatinilyticus TaxID=2582913 RepID=UPI001105A6AD|nr:hypothetical protein [Luteithermobacter gelatinilyticus]